MTIHPEIQNAIKRCSLVFFIGAGFSKQLRLPDWNKLVHYILDSLVKDYPDSVLLSKISTGLKKKTISEIEALDILRQHHYPRILELLEQKINIAFDDKDLRRHQKLWHITDQIITTNYDKGLEQCAPEQVQKVVYKDDFRIAKLSAIEQFLFKVHGCIDQPSECILFSEQYEKLYDPQTGPYLELFKLLSDKTIIFIGFGLRDPYLNKVLALRQKAYKKLKSNNFIINTGIEDFTGLGVEKIKAVKNYSKDLDIFLDELISLRKKYPYALGMLIRGFEKEGIEYNEEEALKIYQELLEKVEQRDDSKAIAKDIKIGKFKNAEEKLITQLNSSLTAIEKSKENAAENAFELGKLNQLQLKFNEAFLYYKKAIEIFPDKSLYYNEAGCMLDSLGKFDEAIQYYEAAIKINITKEKNDSAANAGRLSNIGLSLMSRGNFDKALEYLNVALKLAEQDFDENKRLIARIQNNIGGIFLELGNYPEAIDHFQKAFALEVTTAPFTKETFLMVGKLNSNMGTIHLYLGEYDDALSHFENALDFYKDFGENHPEVAIIYSNMGAIYLATNKNEEALTHFQKAVIITQQFFDEDHPDMAKGLNNVGSALDKLGEHQKALEYFKKVLLIEERVFGKDSPATALTYNNIGGVYLNLEEYNTAIAYFEQSLAINKQCFGEKHPEIATNNMNLGSVWILLKEYKKSLPYFEEAFAINNKFLGEAHIATKACIDHIKLCHEQLESKNKS